MKTSHIFWGVLFVTLGALALINNFTSIHLDWWALLKMWPLLLILWGASLIVKNNAGKSIMAALIAALIALTIFSGFKSIFLIAEDGFVFHWHDDDKWEITSEEAVSFTEPFSENFTEAKLVLEAGAGSYRISGTAEELFKADVEGEGMRYDLIKNEEDNYVNLIFKLKGKKIRFKNGEFKNKVNMSLNPNPDWVLDFNLGAAAIDFDLSPYKIKKADIDMGAASLRIRLGDLVDESHLKIQGGASSIEILVPESVGCQIDADVALSSKNFHGFKNINDDIYRTENFQSAGKKIYLKIDAGVSSVTVRRY